MSEEQIFEMFDTSADQPRTTEQFFDAAENKHSWLAVNPFRLMHKHGVITIGEAISSLRMYDKWRTPYKGELPADNSVAALPTPAKVFRKYGDGTETEHDMRQFWTMVQQDAVMPARHVAIWQFLYDKGIATPSEVIEGLKVWNDWRADI